MLIIDFQKQFIVDQQNFGNQQPGYMNNECIIEEDNEEDTDGQNTMRKYGEEESESEDEVLMQNNSEDILPNSNRPSQISSSNQRESQRYSKVDSIIDNTRNNEQDEQDFNQNNYDSNFSLGHEEQSLKYDSNQNNLLEAEKISSSENDYQSDEQYPQEEPVVNKTLVMLQKELHKSLFSPSLMKINESPKVSLLTNRSKKVNVPNIFGMNARPSSGEVVSPTSEENSSRHSIRKDHLSKDNRYQMQDANFSDN